MKDNVSRLAAAGANHILWPNLPPMERVPEAAGFEDAIRDGLKQASEKFRDDQTAAIKMIIADHANANIHVLDVHGLFKQVVDKPGQFGLTNVTSGVIDAGNFGGLSFTPKAKFPDEQVDADKFLFWDQLHPTARGHDLLGREAFKLVPEPCSLWIVMSGLIVASGFYRRRQRPIRRHNA